MFKPHSDKQERALFTEKKILALLTGIQFGKTTVGALRMKVRMHTHTSPEDAFIIAAPNYKIMQQSTLPEFLKVMRGLGEYNKSDAVFTMHGGGKCYMRTATEPDSIVGITNVRGIWIDEAGKVSLYFWENAVARSGFKDCPIDLTSSPYSFNWLFKEIVKPKLKDRDSLPYIEFIEAASWENPFFPMDTIDKARLTMDPRRFNALFGGKWERMEGLVYNCFDDEENICEPFPLPDGTRYFAGVDWGHTHPFALVVRAITPKGRHYQVSEVYKAGLTMSQIVEICLQKRSVFNIDKFYCDPAQPGNIEELCRRGLPAVAANNDVRLGIDRHYELIKTRQYKVFAGTSPFTLDEYETYHYAEPDVSIVDKDIKERGPVKQHDDACFIAGTKIMVNGSEKNIEDVVVGDLVDTPAGKYPVTACGMTGTANVMTVRFSDGTSLTGTPNHKIYKPFRGFVQLRDLKQNDMLPQWNDQKLSNTAGKSITYAATTISVLATELYYTALSMKIILGKSLMVLKSIISTSIHSIMTQRILRPCAHPTTTGYTQTWFQKNGRNKEQSISLASITWQRLGMLAQKVSSGTESTEKELGLLKKQSAYLALTAKKSSSQKALTLRIVRTLVNRALDVKVVWMMCKYSAQRAAKHLIKTNIAKPDAVRLVALEKCSRPQRVYNLTVGTLGSYITGGFYSRNCDANRYVTMGTWRGVEKLTPKNPDEQKKYNLSDPNRFKKRNSGWNDQTEKWG